MSGVGQNPNMLVNPAISPPYPLWEATTTYYIGDVVSYAGQNWLCLFFADNPTQEFSAGDLYAPDLYPITLNTVPGESPGVYVPVAAGPVPQNLNGGSWINLSLATPPAPVWSPTASYNTGDTVMYPPWNPGTFWRANQPNQNQIPTLPYFDPSAVPPRIFPQYWSQLSGANVPSQNPASYYVAGGVVAPPPPTNFTVTSSNDSPLVLTWEIPAGVSYDSLELTNLTSGISQTLAGNAITATDAPTDPQVVNTYQLIGNYYALQTTPVTAFGYVNTPQLLTLSATQSLTTPANCLLQWSYNPNMDATSAPYTAFNIYVGGLLVTPPSPIDPFSNPQSQTIVLAPAGGPYTIAMTGESALGESNPIQVTYTPTVPPP